MDSTLTSQVVSIVGSELSPHAIWVFGSFGEGREHRDSDVDIAVLVDASLPSTKQFEMQNRLADVLGRDVDLVDLLRASPILQMQVMRHGVLVLDANPSKRRRFEEGVLGRYEDLKLVRRGAENAILGRFYDGRS